MKKAIILLLCMLPFYRLSAQNISGILTDSNRQPIEYANIIALNPADSAFVQGTTSDHKGAFSIAVPDEKAYIIKVSCIGYQTEYRNGNGAIGTLTLKEDVHLISEVEVKGQMPTFQLKGDKFVTQVQGSLLSKLGTANDVLERIPGIEGRQGKFTVFGKGTPIIYINGRKVYDVSELEKITSDEIRSVDLINNPGTEYDASVKAVLKIRLIRRKGDGFSVNATSQLSQTHRTSHYQQLNLNYRHGGLDIFTRLSFQQWKDWQQQENNQTIKADTVWNIRNRLHLESDGGSTYSASGFNYELNENHSFGAQYSGTFSMEGNGGWVSDMDITANGTADDHIHNVFTETANPARYHSVNTYYLGKVRNLDIDMNFDYIKNKSGKEQESVEDSQIGNDRIVNTRYEADNDLYAFKLTLSHPAGNGTLKAGTEMSWTEHRDSYVNPEHILPDSRNSLKEAHSAAFVSYSIPLQSWYLSAGLRYEHIRNRYYVDNVYNETQSRNYDNIFPNLSLSKAFGDVQTSLSYNAYTSRPSYSSLSSNRQYNDRFTYQGGNPFLQPTTTHDVTLNMSYKWLYFVASYQYNKNAICSSIEPYEDDPQLCIWIPRNVKKKQDLWVMLNASPNIGCWHPSFSVSLIRQFMNEWTVNPDRKPYHPRLYAGIQNMFNLPHHFILNVDGMCKSDTYEGKAWRPGFGSVHIGLSKSFLKDEALTLQIRAFDLLKAFRNSGRYYADSITFDTWNYSDSRSLTVTVRYKFNTANNKYKGSGAGNKEKSRL
ncbi:outer membrane beta-barrel protein [Parabacteroides acidifaciens]|uniref:Outer membrane beta-barrel protein n=1 Tax=Parabacteroides acidifaciens TaxID=2290935 RepID=A0A3D8HC02_9BACT|nr:outer membrane beta-barrel family protein [Parabacteroides acidifaciens]MBC8603205.1 outer membrane beta-barrel protein [Parabacteroides acidifaciens]RDU48067.1 TonB-dependent receptor [Parabacteroides acidifaciens]